MKNKALFISTILLLIFISCDKDKKTPEEPVVDNPPVSTEPGTLTLEFNNLFGNSPFAFATNYVTANNDTVKINKFLYYISNLVLIKSDNSEYALPNSYHLINHSKAGSNILNLSGIPVAEYRAVKLTLGVDSARNVSGAQTGDLDPAKASGMFWSWNTGYIFLMIEGSSPQSGSASKSITYHIGGYGGANKAQRNFNIAFNGNLVVNKTTTPKITLNVNVAEFFKTPNTVKVGTTFNQVSAGAGAKVLADNYADMITFREIKN